MRRTKIVCTIGPASGSSEVIRDLMNQGMDVARLNFSHGTHAEHKEKIRIIRTTSDRVGKYVAILQDLCGPKIRVGEIPDPGVRLAPGQSFVLTTEEVMGSAEMVSVSYKGLAADVKKNDRILLADGMMELVVKKKTDTQIKCQVITGGVLTSHKGINLPTGTIKTAALTDKDKDDLAFGLKEDVDFVALSFVRSAHDIMEVKDIIKQKKKNIPVIAKIEKHEALENIDEILEVSDAIMVARGDLGVEIPLENVPGIQKMLIRKANKIGKPVIIATQMLRSMVDSPRPTRAEATDVANGVLDGADAVMLSEETAAGNYPLEAVQYMARIILSAEKHFPHDKYLEIQSKKGIPESVSYASCILADQLDARAIVATTQSGSTARHISKYRPKPIIIALSTNKEAARRLSLSWGCIPHYVKDIKDTEDMFKKAQSSALGSGYVSKEDLVIITAGHPIWVSGTTNMIKVVTL